MEVARIMKFTKKRNLAVHMELKGLIAYIPISGILQKRASSSKMNAIMQTRESYTESEFIQIEFY